jgi:hypothetical protein
MEKAYEQQKSGVAGATAPPPAPAAPVAPSAVSAPAPAPSAAPVVPAPTPAPAPAPTAPAPTTAPANELSNWLKRSPTTETPAVQQVIATTPTTPAEVVHAVDNKEPVVAADKPLSKAKKAVNPADVGLTKEELGMKNHLLGMYGGKNNPAALDAYEKVKEILGYTPAYPSGQGGSLAKEETAKILGYRKEEIPGPKINLTKDMKSILKKGGEAAAVLAATIEFANAKTSEQKATAGTNLLGAVLPPGADILEAGAPTVSGQSISNAYKLGSPYAQTEEAKKARLKEKAGAGRGIAPPSAYMR